MDQHLSRADFPWQTGNAALAFTLYIAGIPFADKDCPLTNTYDAAILKARGYKGEIEESAAAAFAYGIKGRVTYGFAQALQLTEAIAAFDAQQIAVAATANPAGMLVCQLQTNLATGLLSPAGAISGATCIVLKRWREELSQWEQVREFTMQQQKHKGTDYNGREIAEKVFMAGGFYAFAAVIMDARKAFLNLWKNYQPLIELHRGGKPNQDGERVKMPGFLYYSPNAERETRRSLGVPTK